MIKMPDKKNEKRAGMKWNQEQMPVLQRITWVDINRFVLIFLVVAGHVSTPYNAEIYLFHIPAFFFLSGYTANFHQKSFPKFIWKKFQSLIIPYFCINIAFFLLRYMLHCLDLEAVFYKDVMTLSQLGLKMGRFFKYASSQDIGGATWFLVVLFSSNVMGFVVLRFAEKCHVKDWITLLACIPVYIFCFYLHSHKIYYPYMTDLALHALIYFILGFLFHKHQVFFLHINHAYALPISAFLIYFFGRINWIPMNWPTRYFDTPGTNFIAALAGIYLSWFVSVCLGKIKILNGLLSYLGTKTLSILFFHFIGLRLFYLMLYLTGNGSSDQVRKLVAQNHDIWFYKTVFGIGFSVLIDYFIRKNDNIAYLFLGSRAIFNERGKDQILPDR
ncbi:acyltransferase family protein [uncultured Desulfobacter sp.]|uniref:acyltransferase family protein n=1 Tax=uncultured Desulfobacter sp. TaxID=240139 RepID=UPI002AAC2F2A|nr:acyltransferase family protein [uncultured Desulfobacter sp.]